MSAEERARHLGLDLGRPPSPVANYVPAVRAGNLVFLSGHVPPAGEDGTRPQGKVGAEFDVEAAYQVARAVAVSMLASLRAEIGSLDRVRRVVKVTGLVNASESFTQHPQVINGASDLLVEVFGPEIGKHARTAAGAGSLPANVPVEIDMVVEVEA
jgi:enamine deaminase RidA (YjgF/YER057c/UK114 family)